MEKEVNHGLLYIKISEKLKSDMENGILKPGVQLPGVRQLAEEFETSVKTVSRALDELEDSGYIERTQGKGIFTKAAAGVTASNSLWGCLCPGSGDYAADNLVTALEEQAGASAGELLIRRFEPVNETFSDLVGSMMEKKVRGLFIVSSDPPPGLSISAGLPFFYLGGCRDLPVGLHSIAWDLRGGMDLCVEHLTGNGHTDMGFIGGDSALQHFRSSLARMGLEFDPARTELVSPGGADGFSSMCNILSRSGKITALICMHDSLAAGALKAAENEGLSVPEDVCVIGWGGTDLGAMAVPAITTLSYDSKAMASAALGCMERITSAPHAAGYVLRMLIPLDLIVRDSSVNREDYSDDRWV